MGIHAMIQSTDKYPGESTRVDASRSLKKFLLMVTAPGGEKKRKDTGREVGRAWGGQGGC